LSFIDVSLDVFIGAGGGITSQIPRVLECSLLPVVVAARKAKFLANWCLCFPVHLAFGVKGLVPDHLALGKAKSGETFLHYITKGRAIGLVASKSVDPVVKVILRSDDTVA
jgi:hypothetical protein